MTAQPALRAIGSLRVIGHDQRSVALSLGCDYLHHFANIADECARFADLDGLIECETGRLEKLLGVFVDFTNRVCLVQVAVVS